MPIWLKQSTSVVVSFGPFVSPTDGVTLQTGLVSALDHASTGIFLSKNGGTLTIRHASVTASSYDAYGNYKVTLDTTDTNTLGTLRMQFAAAASCLVVWQDFMVVPANIWDSYFGSDALDVSVIQWLGVAVTAATGGIPDTNAKNINNVATTSVTTINANQGTTQPVNYTGTGASALVKSDMVDIAGAAVSTTSAQIGVNAVQWNALATVELPLVPTTAGRKLDVSAGGEAGVDWANVGSPTTTVTLSGTTVKTATDVEADTQDIQSRLPAALTGDGNIKADSLRWNGLATVALPLIPTVAGRSLDVSAGGEAGVDWANVGSPTTSVGLTNTTISTSQVVASVSGAVGSVTGAVGSVTGNVGGNVVGTVASVVGNVGGNVVGTVASVVGNVGGNVTGNVTGTIGGFTVPALAQFFITDTTKVFADAVAGSVVKETGEHACDCIADLDRVILDQSRSPWTFKYLRH